MKALVPSNFWRMSALSPHFFDEFWEDNAFAQDNAIGISEDEKNVYVELSMPGADAKNIEITFDRGILWVKYDSGIVEEKDDKKKYHLRAQRSFNYRVTVPGEIDFKIEPQATYKNGVMTVSFTKTVEAQPKKIAVKSE